MIDVHIKIDQTSILPCICPFSSESALPLSLYPSLFLPRSLPIPSNQHAVPVCRSLAVCPLYFFSFSAWPSRPANLHPSPPTPTHRFLLQLGVSLYCPLNLPTAWLSQCWDCVCRSHGPPFRSDVGRWKILKTILECFATKKFPCAPIVAWGWIKDLPMKAHSESTGDASSLHFRCACCK